MTKRKKQKVVGDDSLNVLLILFAIVVIIICMRYYGEVRYNQGLIEGEYIGESKADVDCFYDEMNNNIFGCEIIKDDGKTIICQK